jgi:hypothetical protein
MTNGSNNKFVTPTARANGSVGGEITRRLVQMGQNQLTGNYNIQNK